MSAPRREFDARHPLRVGLVGSGMMGFEHVRNLRIGTKSMAYWPQRYVTDNDADDLMAFFEEIVGAGRHLALMAHWTHPRELEPEMARRAVARVRATGAQIRMQAPLVRHVNDDAEAWASMWRTGVKMGMIPYYMFVERNTGPKNYFEVPLARAHRIFADAYRQVSGLARTVRGRPSSILGEPVAAVSTAPARHVSSGTARTRGNLPAT